MIKLSLLDATIFLQPNSTHSYSEVSCNKISETNSIVNMHKIRPFGFFHNLLRGTEEEKLGCNIYALQGPERDVSLRRLISSVEQLDYKFTYSANNTFQRLTVLYQPSISWHNKHVCSGMCPYILATFFHTVLSIYFSHYPIHFKAGLTADNSLCMQLGILL